VDSEVALPRLNPATCQVSRVTTSLIATGLNRQRVPIENGDAMAKSYLVADSWSTAPIG
jgi:hypothetical protein